MEGFWKRTAIEVALGAVAGTIFCLFAAALAAVFVRAYLPSDLTVTLIGELVKCVSAFLGALLFVKPGRAIWKGAASGAVGLLLSTLVFGCIGGFRIGVLFLFELLLALLFGALGALLGAKLRKE